MSHNENKWLICQCVYNNKWFILLVVSKLNSLSLSLSLCMCVYVRARQQIYIRSVCCWHHIHNFVVIQSEPFISYHLSMVQVVYWWFESRLGHCNSCVKLTERWTCWCTYWHNLIVVKVWYFRFWVYSAWFCLDYWRQDLSCFRVCIIN